MTGRGIEIRQAAIQEAEEAGELFDQYRVFYQQPSDRAGAERFVRERLANLESVIFLAWDRETGRAVGFMQLYPSFSSVSMQRLWILNDLFVAEESRRRGVARMLLEAAHDYAVHTGAKGIELSTAANNAKAQALYESFGFRKDEEYFHYFYKA